MNEPRLQRLLNSDSFTAVNSNYHTPILVSVKSSSRLQCVGTDSVKVQHRPDVSANARLEI